MSDVTSLNNDEHDARWALLPLLAALSTTPVPGAPPRYERADEATGLAILEVGLTMEHVSRINETLRLVDERNMDRTVHVDVDLRSLSRRQLAALAARRWVAEDKAAQLLPRGPASVWIPIARLRRRDAGPVVVRDAAGSVVPRLTSQVTQAVFAAGLSRSLKLVLAARAAESIGAAHTVALPKLPQQARWLIERTMASLIASEDNGEARGASVTDKEIADTKPSGDESSPRLQAWTYLRALIRRFPADAAELGHLLTLASSEQFLIVAVPTNATHQQLAYDAPSIHVARSNRWARWGARLAHGYRVAYHTQIPSGVRSFHLTVTLPEELYGGQFALVTDSGLVGVTALLADLRFLAGQANQAEPRLTEVFNADLNDVVSRLCGLIRLRSRQASAFADTSANKSPGHLDDSMMKQLAGLRGLAQVLPPHDVQPLVEILLRLPPSDLAGVLTRLHGLRGLAQLLPFHDAGRLIEMLLRLPPGDLAGVLTHLADVVALSELHLDVIRDNDPRDNVVHAHWHYQGVPFARRSIEPLDARATLRVTDETPALLDSVLLMIAGLVAITFGVALVAPADHPLPDQKLEVDAVVTMLLLIPGILLTRLDIRKTHTLIDQVRRLPRRLAYLSVAVTSALSALIAIGVEARFWRWAAVGGLGLLGVVGLGALLVRGRRHARRKFAPATAEVPLWLLQMTDRSARDSLAAPSAAFTGLTLRENEQWTALTDSSTRDAPLGLGRARPASAARAAARSAFDRSTGVVFAVRHLPPAPGAAGGSPRLPESQATDVLLFRAWGSYCSIHVARSPEPGRIVPLNGADLHSSGQSRARRPEVLRTEPLQITERERTPMLAGGSALLSPGQRGLGANRSEVLVSLADEVDLSFCRSRASMSVLADMVRLTRAEEAVPLYLHFPAAPPARPVSPDGREADRRSVLPCVRLALANAGGRETDRFCFEQELLVLAQKRRLGLHLNSGRASSQDGFWRQASPVSEEGPLRDVYDCGEGKGHHEGKCRSRVQYQLLVTFVAPVASTAMEPLAKLAEALNEHFVGCLGASIWSLQDTLFVNLLLAVPPERRLKARFAHDEHPALDLTQLLKWCGRGAPSSSTVELGQTFTIALSSLHRVADNVPEPGRRFVPFWSSWNVPDDENLTELQALLVESMTEDPMVDDADILFLRARRHGRDRLRGRAKLRVSVPESAEVSDLALLAQRSQERLMQKRTPGRPPADLDTVHLAWGENWLGPVD